MIAAVYQCVHKLYESAEGIVEAAPIIILLLVREYMRLLRVLTCEKTPLFAFEQIRVTAVNEVSSREPRGKSRGIVTENVSNVVAPSSTSSCVTHGPWISISISESDSVTLLCVDMVVRREGDAARRVR